MEQETGSFEELCMDEAVCFIADRHHVPAGWLQELKTR